MSLYKSGSISTSTDVSGISGSLNTALSNLRDVTSKVAANAFVIAANSSLIATHTAEIALTNSTVSANTGAIASNSSAIAAAEISISNTSGAITSVNNDLIAAVSTLNGSIDANTSAIAATNSNVNTNASAIAANTSAIAALPSSSSASFTTVLSGTIPTASCSGSFVRADGNLTLPAGTSGMHFTCLAGAGGGSGYATLDDSNGNQQTFQGTTYNARLGTYSAFSTDGSVMVIGANRQTVGVNEQVGAVYIYRKDSNSEYQLEQLLEGEFYKDYFGNTVDVDGDGTRIVVQSAMSGYNFSTNTTQSNNPDSSKWQGFASVFHYDASATPKWSLHTTIKGSDYSSSQAGFGVCAMSKDGTHLVVSSKGANSNTGIAQVFQLTNNVWSQKGSTIVGPSNAQLGYAVDINSDGSRVAAGMKNYNGNTGGVNVYDYGTDWTVNTTLPGDEVGEQHGKFVQFNSDGTILATTAFNNDDSGNSNVGEVHVYQESGSTWTQLGSPILGKNIANDKFGERGLGLSDDGLLVMSGSIRNESMKGYARLYEYDGSAWVVKYTVDGVSGESNMRDGGAISRDKSTFLVVENQKSHSSTYGGQVYLHHLPASLISAKTITPAANEYINGSATAFTVNTLANFACSTNGQWVAA